MTTLLCAADCLTPSVNESFMELSSPKRCNFNRNMQYRTCTRTSGRWVPGLASNYEECLSTMVYTRGKNCNTFCNGNGLDCLRAQDNRGRGCSLDSRHSRKTQADNGCQQTWINQICTCGKKEVQGCRLPGGKTCNSLSGSWVPSIAENTLQCADVVAWTNGGTCNKWCADRGFKCLRAQDNHRVSDACSLDPGHQRQTQEENGCNQQWKTQICTCGNVQMNGNVQCSEEEKWELELKVQDAQWKMEDEKMWVDWDCPNGQPLPNNITEDGYPRSLARVECARTGTSSTCPRTVSGYMRLAKSWKDRVHRRARDAITRKENCDVALANYQKAQQEYNDAVAELERCG